MQFEQMLGQVREQPSMSIEPNWAQGRAGFGGLIAALAYEAMAAHVPADRPLRSLALTFVGPVAPGVPFSVAVEVLREGRAVSQVMAKVLQNGEVATLLQASFGGARDSQINLSGPAAPVLPMPENCQALPQIPGVTPAFTEHIDMRWGVGGLPFSDTPSRQMGGWVRFRTASAEQRLNTAHLIALVDAWPPAVLPYLSKPAPGSSLSWTIEFVHPQPELKASDWCSYLADIEYAREGYGHIAAQMWSSDGQLIALSRQTVAVFA